MIRIAARLAGFLAVAPLLIACSGVTSLVTRDSAGIEIVEHAPIRNPPVAFRLASQPTFALGGLHDDPNYELGGAFLQLARLWDGRVVVVDDYRLKFFDASGKFLNAVGAKGRGPGEFRQISHLCVAPGDTVIAVGYGDRRVAVYDEKGALVHAGTMPGEIWGQPCFPDGTLLVNSGTDVDPKRGAPRPEDLMDPYASYSRARFDGTIINEVGVFPHAPVGLIQREVSVVAHDDVITVGDAKTWEYRQYTIGGKLTRIVRVNEPPIPISEAEFQRVAQGRISPTATAEARLQQIEKFRRMGVPPAYPSYSVLLVDDAKRVWVRDYFTVKPNGWTVFDSTGSLLGRFSLPSDSTVVYPEIVQIGRDDMQLRWQDADGAQHLGYFPLLPPK
jgi:hypothetical protein